MPEEKSVLCGDKCPLEWSTHLGPRWPYCLLEAGHEGFHQGPLPSEDKDYDVAQWGDPSRLEL